MRIKALVIGAVLFVLAAPAETLAQSCNGDRFDRFRDTCRANFIEIETRNEGLLRLHQGDDVCFYPTDPDGWLWYCRGYEEDARCHDSRGQTAVFARMENGEIQWSCFED